MLPERTWLYLCEALALLTAKGIAVDVAEDRLRAAFRHGEIRTQGSLFGNIKELHPGEWVNGQVNWQGNTLTVPYGMYDGEASYEIEVHRDDLVGWLRLPTSSRKSPVYRSPYMALMLAAENHFGLRLQLARGYAKKEEVEGWLREQWDSFISAPMSENMITNMAKLIRDPELGKGGNRRLS